MPKIILTSPGFGLQTHELTDGTITVGRHPKNNIVIQDDSVSGDHCDLLVYGLEVIVREHGSRNGTFVDGVRVQVQSGVNHGQKLRFGNVEARMDIESYTKEDGTAITAIYQYRRILQQPPPLTVHSPAPPIVIAPEAARPAGTDHTIVMAKAPAATPAVPPGERASGDRRLRTPPRWLRLALGFALGFALVLGLLLALWSK